MIKVLLVSFVIICVISTSAQAHPKNRKKVHNKPTKQKHASIDKTTHKPTYNTPKKLPSKIKKTQSVGTGSTITACVTAYTTSKKECGNSKGITASGRKAVPWTTASVGYDMAHLFNKKNPKKIKIQGFDTIWVVTDRKKKGYKGIDICVGKGTAADVKLAKNIGKSKRTVYIQ
jgi:hypothetical protein